MKRLLILILLLALAAGGYIVYTNYYATDATLPAAGLLTGDTASLPFSRTIAGSGAIEAETILVTSEIGGRIVDVLAAEGAEVAAGDVLVRLDDSLLKARRAELEAAIAAAKENLVATQATPQPADIAVDKAALAQAKTQQDGAYQIWQEMVKVEQEPQTLLVPIRDLQAQVKQAEKAVEAAQVEQRSAIIQEENAARDQSGVGKTIHEIAHKRRLAADTGIDLANANLQALQVQLAHLWEQYNTPIQLQIQTRQAESAYRIAEAAVTLAEARLAATRAGPRAEDIALAEAQVILAESGRALLETQQSQLTLTAPRDGLITTRSAEPGEMAIPGAILLSLADLDKVTLRVYIPETQIGRVKLGQPAQVRIDSVARPFEGVVTYIASEAEFTPQNVQIATERVNLIFAVEISLDNPDHILKPGMPADAEIKP